MYKPKKLHQLGKLIVACEAYIIQKGRVLMCKRAEDKKIFPGFWVGPGGHIDEGEDALSAVIREVKEETGVIISDNNIKLKVLAFHHHVDRKELWVEYLFKANIAQSVKIISTNEGESKWIKIPKLFKMRKVFPPSKHYFDHIFNDKPGILYNFSEWKNAKIVKVLSEQIGE